jgi:TolB-like protein/DNA-binding winged helix-turn-helix (wHTH) protein/Tfp pilus assembly protein PilF
MDEQLQPAYEFDGFRVDPVRRMLLGTDGRPIPLKPKVFDTLLYFVEHPQVLLDRRTLLKSIWPNVVVEENNLNQAVSTLRRVLGERPEDHRFILTEPGRGYRFVAKIKQSRASVPLQASATEHAPLPRDTKISRKLSAAVALMVALLIAASAFIILGQRDLRSIAVLPFENLSTDEEYALFARAIQDDILTQLAKIRDLKVISRASVMQYQERTHNLREIGNQLGAATILEGTVQRAADTVHVNVQLVDAQTGELLWIESYDREPTVENIFAIQTDIAKSIANALEATLTPTEMSRLNDQPTLNNKAYDFYLSGREYYRGSDLQRDLPAAVQQFERAVEQDPEFALAHSYLAISNIHMYWTIDRTDTRRNMAYTAAQRALKLQPDLPDAHLAMAWYQYQGHLDYEAALKELAIAEQAMPGNADLLFAQGAIYRRMGRWQEAVTSWERAIELDPRNANLLRQQASSYQMLRDYARAEHYLERVLEIAPDAVEGHTEKAAIPLLRDGDDALYLKAIVGNPLVPEGNQICDQWKHAIRDRDYDTALRHLGEWDGDVIHQFRSYYLLTASAYGVTYRLAGQAELARAQFESAREQLENALERNPDQPRLLIALGEVMAGLGEPEAATRLALKAIKLMPTSREAMDGPVYQIDAIMRVLAPAGAVDVALEQLDAYFAAPGFWSIEGILTDPRLDPIRDDPRFDALVEKYKRQ